MQNEYPKALYKTKEDTITVNSIEAEEKAAKEGYGDYEVVVLGRKPQAAVEKEEKAADEAELTKKLTAEIKAELQKDFDSQLKAKDDTHEKAFEKGVADLNKKLETTENNMAEVNKAFEKRGKEVEKLTKELEKLKKEKTPAPA